MDVESLGDVSVSSSIERQNMREQLDAVRQTLNSLANTTQPHASGVNAAQAGLDGVLSDIASKLANIEGLYTNLTSKLEKVDLRVEDSERHIKDLQHFSASTIHETARLVDFVGNNRTPGTRGGSQAGAGPSGISAGASLRARNLAASGVPSTPPPPGVSPSRSSIPPLDFVSGHLTTTIQQHAAQIHKLIAGLDFLEAHIIRQDQVVNGLQKQLQTVARDVAANTANAESRTSPSELSLRIHDMSELLNKLRAHMFKVEKKTGNNDQALMLLTQRIQAVEQAGGRQQQQRGEAGETSSSEQDTIPGPSVMELAASQEEVRSMVQDLCRDVLELRDQVQAQAATQALQPATSVAASGLSAEDGVEMRRQLSFLMSQVPTLLVENKELNDLNTAAQKRIDDLAAAFDQQQRQLQQQQQPATAPYPPAEAGSAAPVHGATAAGAAAELRGTVASLQQQVAALEGRLAGAASRAEVEALSSAVQAVECKAAEAAPSPARNAELDFGLIAVRDSVAEVQERIAALQAGLAERKEEAAATRVEVGSLSAALQALSAAEQQSRSPSADPAVDAVAKVMRTAPGTSPEAAVFAAQVSAAAKADLEEQFGQLRHKVEVAAGAAAAAEEAARSSAESAAAAAAALEAASKVNEAAAAAANDASLQETVLAMVAGVEQEQTVLKQQLAQLAAQVSEEQAAISSGLLQVQEQVAAAANAATEAVAAAQAMQEAQSSTVQQEQQSAELRAVVASVMEQLKERVEQGMQEVEAQLSAFGGRLSIAITAEQLEAALRESLAGVPTQEALQASLGPLRAAVADTAGRHELDAASLDQLREELILLTGQQDVTQSRLQGLETLLGVDARSSPLGRRRTTTSSIPPTIEEGEAEGEDADEEVDVGAAAEERDGDEQPEAEQEAEEAAAGEATREVLQLRVSGLGVLPGAISPGGRGLLDLVAELQSRVGGLEGALVAAATDMDQLRDLMQSNQERTQDTIQQATAQLISDLQGLSAAVDERAASAAADLQAMEAASAALQQRVADQAGVTTELATHMREVQLRLENDVVARINETSAAVSSLSDRIARDYINREQLGAIFKARDDMKRAMNELATVFNTGCLVRTASADEDTAAAGSHAEPDSAPAQNLSPRLVSALEDLAGKQAELEHQVQLALYRTDGAVRQEQLASVQQAMMTLEMQFRRLTGTTASSSSAAAAVPAQAAAPADLADLRTRVESLEAILSATAPATAAAVTPRASGAPPAVERSDSSALRVHLTPEDAGDDSSPIRLRLMVADAQPQPFADSAVPLLDIAADDANGAPCPGPEEEVGEPSLSSMLHGGGSSSTPTNVEGHGSTSAEDAPSHLQELRHAVSGLASQAEVLRCQVAAESAERQRLAEALSELTERLDLQVNTTASTAAMIATMATDSPAQRVALQVRVGATEAEADVAALAATVSTLTARLDAAEEALSSAFIVRTPRSPTRAAAAAAAVAPAAPFEGTAQQPDAETVGSADGSSEAGEGSDGSDGAAMRPALGLMVPVLPREVEQQIAGLQAEAARLEAALGGLAGRVDGLEAADALEEVRAAASEAVLDAIPGMVSQQVSVVRQEIEAMMSRQGEQLLEIVGQAARDAAEAVLAVREAAAEATAAKEAVMEGLAEREAAARAAAEVAEAAATEAAAQAAAAREAATEAEEAAAAASATASAREAALEVAMLVAREVAEETVREATARASSSTDDAPQVSSLRDEELFGSVSRLAAELKDVRGAVGSLTERINDVDALRDQLEAIAAQVRDTLTSSAAAGSDADAVAASANPSAQGPPSTPTAAAAVASIFTPAATALVIPPAHTPRGTGGASPSPGGSRQVSAATSSQQANFLARLVAVVKRQSSRLHAQYSDAEETGMALAQVDSTLEEAEARLADVRDANSPAFAETLVTVLEQVAALRYIGSQTHPAVQQMVLEHENRLDKIAEELKALGAGSPLRTSPAGAAALAAATAAPPAAVLEEVSLMSRQVTRLETELTRVAGQQTALDRAVKDMLAAVGSVRLGSVSGSSVATGSRRVSAHDGYAPEAPTASAPPRADAADAAAAMAADATDAAEAEADGAGVPSSLEITGLAAQVRLLEDTLEVQLGGLRQELMTEIRTRVGSGGGAAAVTAASAAADLSALEKTVSQLHSAVTAIRNRLLAMQEYVDSTQGMIKDMHVGLGGLHRRVDALEATVGPGSRSARVSSSGTAEPSNVRELQADLVKFERRLLVVESSSLEAAHALAGLKGLAPRVTEAETRLQDACCKLAVALGGSASASSVTAPVIPAVMPGGSLPVLAGSVRALERRLGGRMEAACGALDTLAGALSAAGKIQAESTANPFKAISAAVNNPVMVAMEKKLETVRAEILTAATTLSEDMRRDAAQAQLESRLASADTSTRGGSEYGGGGALTFRV